jgi:hypothetical protein
MRSNKNSMIVTAILRNEGVAVFPFEKSGSQRLIRSFFPRHDEEVICHGSCHHEPQQEQKTGISTIEFRTGTRH